ncbi:SDR family NAD(P)-dependent oxidoreductase [Nocardioides panzhihuensis]|uniref:NAD(P)-dependent dehydrogenase (Short-subunit alcohol dehydrogenase family) n=1 Tax=Nocardioides panzhihuensis TaxID=860243 RepID=A0A7Z0DJI1_9ACTN|nr:SDR family NAD(P)-dependent oxidoreductase [Nocardioides panzhihuensis]NYI76381.1 NAD(P)-dependent dehydrogenase (short-subunit alcohol dehydrogenase family) [Nocardioides panzhihuensis]
MSMSIILVTGASSGIGLAVARLAATRGDHVVLVARGRESLDATARGCERLGAASTMVLPLDVGDDDAVGDCIGAVLDRHGRIDTVIHCAGVVAFGRTESLPPEIFDGVLRTNLLGSANVARHVVPVLRGQGSGTLVLVGSALGHITVPSMSPYVISKWGVRALAHQLRLENRDRPDVAILYVAPGGVDTPIYHHAASVIGHEGRPPPPVSSPQRAARQILRRVDRGRGRPQLSMANDVTRLVFAAPLVHDRVVAPIIGFLVADLARPVDPHPGNVLTSMKGENAMRGRRENTVLGLARNLAVRITRRGRGTATSSDPKSPRTSP